jgi:hypothetical protein
MQYKSNKGFTGLSQLGMLLLFLGAGLIMASIFQLLIGSKLVPAGTSFDEMGNAIMEAMKDPRNISVSRMLQVVGTLFALFIPAVLYSFLCNGISFFWLGFNRYVNIFQVATGFFLIYAANMIAVPLEDFTKKIIVLLPSLDNLAHQLESTYNEQVILLTNLKSWPELFMSLVIMALLPAMFEEVFFRGALQNLLSKWWQKPFWAILFTSILFSLIHVSVYLFLSRLALGFVLGLMYHQTKNLWVNIIAHFLNNAFAVCQMFMLSRANKKISLDQLDAKVSPWLAVVAFSAIVLLSFLLEMLSSKNKIKIQQQEQSLTPNDFNSQQFL